ASAVEIIIVAAMPVVFLLLTFTFTFSFHGCFVHAGDPELYFNWHVSFAKVSPFGVEKKVRNLSSSSSRLFFLLLPLFPEPCTHHDVQVIVINDRLPGPLLNVTTNNVVSVNVFNNLDDPFLLTWYVHG
ncbi:hypothetical protein BHM03_00030462, partial [Ensete ventricosum]